MNTIFKTIQNSFDLLDLKKNWDSKGASPIDKEIYIQAIQYILKIMMNIEGDTKEFEINACPDGSIDINFRIQKAHLNINVNKNGVSYEGKGPHKNDTMKTINSSSGCVSSNVIDWLNRNLKKRV
ncbi:MAG: hypothetical protein WCL02_05895 [bacterium]